MAQQATHHGIYYEPRALWSVVDRTISGAADRDHVTLPQQDFYNGSRFPITLTRLAMCPVGYLLRESDAVVALSDDTYHNAMSILNVMRVLVSAPFRQHYSRQPVFANAWGARACAEPGSRLATANAGVAVSGYASGSWGLSRLKPDRPIFVPPGGKIDLGLTGWLPEGDVAVASQVRWSLAYLEEGGLFPGSARVREYAGLQYTDNTVRGQSFPFSVDNFPLIAGLNVQGNQYPAQNQLSARDFSRQDGTRQGSTKINSVNIAIDQITHDDTLQGAGVDADITGQPLAPMSTRVGVRARSTDFGSGAFWWQPGCPLALVFNDITPALTYDLAEPITLAPQHGLQVEIIIPALPAGLELTPIYKFGVAFTGFAAIEG